MLKSSPAVEVTLPHLFNPRSYQVPVFKAFDNGCRRFCEVWHRKSGKDLTFLNLTIKAMFERVGMYWMIYPTIKKGREIVWNGMDDEGVPFLGRFPADLVAKKDENDTLIKTTNGSIFQLIGTDRLVGDIVGPNPVGVVFSEFAVMSDRTWNLIRPIIRQNKGWAAFIYTPRGKNHGFTLWDRARADRNTWHTTTLTVDDTFRDAYGESGSPVLTKADIDSDRRDGMPEELVRQEYYCSFEGYNFGTYYGKLLAQAEHEGRIGEVPYRPDLPVQTAWDIGVGDKTAIWFYQFVDNAISFIDYYESHGEGLEHYIKKVLDRPYIYSHHIAPHDIDVQEFGTGKTRLETARDNYGLRFDVAAKLGIDEGISQVRSLFWRFRFDRARCSDGLSALWAYHKVYDEGRKTFREYPDHDWSSDGADALRTMAVGRIEPSGRPVKRAPIQYGRLLGDMSE